ncbi:hypothetical protein I3I95_03735 [bacterium]|nr:hypothetical protein [bacterium]
MREIDKHVECMRHVDMRMKIMRAMLDVLAISPDGEVSLVDVCDSCGVSRSTFYRYFSGILDIPVWYRNYGAEVGMYQSGRRYTCFQGHLISLQMLYDAAPLQSFYVSRTTLDPRFADAASRGHVQSMESVLSEHGMRVDTRLHYEIEAYAYGSYIAVSRWLARGTDLSVCEMARVIADLCPRDLREILDAPSQPAMGVDAITELLASAAR